MKLLKMVADSTQIVSEMVNIDKETIKKILKTDLNMTEICTRMVLQIVSHLTRNQIGNEHLETL